LKEFEDRDTISHHIWWSHFYEGGCWVRGDHKGSWNDPLMGSLPLMVSPPRPHPSWSQGDPPVARDP